MLVKVSYLSVVAKTFAVEPKGRKCIRVEDKAAIFRLSFCEKLTAFATAPAAAGGFSNAICIHNFGLLLTQATVCSNTPAKVALKNSKTRLKSFLFLF